MNFLLLTALTCSFTIIKDQAVCKYNKLLYLNKSEILYAEFFDYINKEKAQAVGCKYTLKTNKIIYADASYGECLK